jgi:methylenetetrahydrofolate reductase (NADPH)
MRPFFFPDHAMKISYEFFPPKTDEQRAQLERTVLTLKEFSPEFTSVTFGAGGSTLSYTAETVKTLASQHGLNAVPHLSCMGGTREEIRQLLNEYKQQGCTRVIALRGDLPSGMARSGDMHYASDLVQFIRQEFNGDFEITVACYPEIHPQAEDAQDDIRRFVEKARLGADSAITQYFYNADAYFRFVDDAHRLGATLPIIPGIMPISNFSQIRRFSQMCGAEIPRWMAQRMLAYGDDADSIREFAADCVADMCRRLLEGGVGELHFYTLNLAKPTVAVLSRLR